MCIYIYIYNCVISFPVIHCIYTLNVNALRSRLRLENSLGKALKVQTRHLGSQTGAKMPQELPNDTK